MYLIMAVLLAIACPYVFMRGTLVGGSELGDLLIAYYIMGRFCYLGQAFVRQVSCLQQGRRSVSTTGNFVRTSTFILTLTFHTFYVTCTSIIFSVKPEHYGNGFLIRHVVHTWMVGVWGK